MGKQNPPSSIINNTRIVNKLLWLMIGIYGLAFGLLLAAHCW